MIRRRPSATFSLSLLDLLCCAFGGVIILSVVFSASISRPSAVTIEPYLVVVIEQRVDQAWPFAGCNPSNNILLALDVIRVDSGKRVLTWGTGPPEETKDGLSPETLRNSLNFCGARLAARFDEIPPGHYELVPKLVHRPRSKEELYAGLMQLEPLQVTWWTGERSMTKIIDWKILIAQAEHDDAAISTLEQYRVCVPGQIGDAPDPCVEVPDGK